MSHLKPSSVIAVAVLDETFAQALLAHPAQALANAHLSLAPEDVTPFLQGAGSLSELAGLVLAWELAVGYAEPPLRVPVLERVRLHGQPSQRPAPVLDDKVLAA